MYEVHPDDKGQWLLYRNREVIGVFMGFADAEFAQRAFSMRDSPLIVRYRDTNPVVAPEAVAMAKKIAEWQKSGACIALPSSRRGGNFKIEYPDAAHAGPTVMFPDEPDTPHIVGDE